MTDPNIVTLDDLDAIVSEMEDIQANGQKPYDPRMREALLKLSEWNRRWAAQNHETMCCKRCGEHWPAAYTDYVHVCLMEGYEDEIPRSKCK